MARFLEEKLQKFKLSSEASASIERARLRAAKEKTEALPRCFSERKIKMVDIRGETSNLLFTTLEQWNEILQDTSIVKWNNENDNFANSDILPKVVKKRVKPKSNKASA